MPSRDVQHYSSIGSGWKMGVNGPTFSTPHVAVSFRSPVFSPHRRAATPSWARDRQLNAAEYSSVPVALPGPSRAKRTPVKRLGRGV